MSSITLCRSTPSKSCPSTLEHVAPRSVPGIIIAFGETKLGRQHTFKQHVADTDPAVLLHLSTWQRHTAVSVPRGLPAYA
eukprot:395040-Rhodomonas_salina.6